MPKDRRQNIGITIKGMIAMGKPGENASKKKHLWETPDGMTEKAIYRHLCDMGRNGGCPRCKVGCRFGEAWMKLGMPEQK